MKTLLSKTALVTGASSGIGKAIALKLAEEGARVIIHFHHQQEAALAVMQTIRNNGGDADVIGADLGMLTEVEELADRAWALTNGIDFLINNAGVSYKKHFLDTTPEDFDHFTNINFRGTLFLTHNIARRMVMANRPGCIYTITSINALQPGVGLSVYGATKGALETLMKGVALELAPHNINVNTFAVGAIRTDMNADTWQNEEKLKTVSSNIPSGRLGEPEEIAAVVCGLLATGSYMTGATITIDGGWTLKHGYTNPTPYKSK